MNTKQTVPEQTVPEQTVPEQTVPEQTVPTLTLQERLNLELELLSTKITYDPDPEAPRNLAISDLHIGHNKEFIYRSRGFEALNLMEQTLITNWNAKVRPQDRVFITGDLFLGPDTEHCLFILLQLNGFFYITAGNHDTLTKLRTLINDPRFLEAQKIRELMPSKYIHYKASDGNTYHLYTSHFPSLTGNLHNAELSQMTINISGHTHEPTEFFYDLPYVWNVACDARNLTPVDFEELIAHAKAHVKDCIRAAQ